MIPLGPDPSAPQPFGGFTNCEWPSERWPAVCFGAMGINTDGLACDPGEGPPRACCSEETCQILTCAACTAIGGD